MKLLKVIKNPVSMHLPIGCRKVLASFQASEYMSCRQFAESAGDKPIALVIGGFAKGKVNRFITVFVSVRQHLLLDQN